MRWPVLLRRREVLVPTLWGGLLALAALVGLLALLVLQAHPFLAPNAPTGARIAVIEGWLSPVDLERAAQLCRERGYERIITAGGPVHLALARLGHDSYARLAREQLVRRGLLPAAMVTAVPAPPSAQDRTFLSAVMVREWLRDSGLRVEQLDVVSSGVHARRSWYLYREALGPQIQVGILSVRPASYDAGAWWNSSEGTKTVVVEGLSWLWTVLFFQPGAAGSGEERWGRPAPSH